MNCTGVSVNILNEVDETPVKRDTDAMNVLLVWVKKKKKTGTAGIISF